MQHRNLKIICLKVHKRAHCIPFIDNTNYSNIISGCLGWERGMGNTERKYFKEAQEYMEVMFSTLIVVFSNCVS